MLPHHHETYPMMSHPPIDGSFPHPNIHFSEYFSDESEPTPLGRNSDQPQQVEVATEAYSPITSYLRKPNTDGLSSTQHTETNMTQDSSAQSFAFDDNIKVTTGDQHAPIEPYMDGDNHDDVSITKEFFQDTKQEVQPQMYNVPPPPPPPPMMGQQHTFHRSFENLHNMGFGYSGPASAFAALNTTNRQSHASAPNLMFSPMTHPGMQQQQQQQPQFPPQQHYFQQPFRGQPSACSLILNGRGHASLDNVFTNSSNGYVSKISSRSNNGSSGSVRKTASLSAMKRSGIAPSRRANMRFNGLSSSPSCERLERTNGNMKQSTHWQLEKMKRSGIAPRRSNPKLSHGMRSRLLKDLYCSPPFEPQIQQYKQKNNKTHSR